MHDVAMIVAGASVRTFVPAADLAATACFARARRRAKFPALPITLEHRPDHVDRWVVTARLPGTDLTWGMTIPADYVELDMLSGTFSPLTFYFEQLRRRVVEDLAALMLRRHGIPGDA